MRLFISIILLLSASCKPYDQKGGRELLAATEARPHFAFPTANVELLTTGGETNFFARTNLERPWQSGAFGCVRNNRTRLHEGIDILSQVRDTKNEPIDQVTASRKGEIVYVNKNIAASNYGKYVVLIHDADSLPVYTLYGHLRNIEEDLAVGYTVEAGEAIGVLGRTANTRDEIAQWRAHLHFEIGVQVNSKFDLWFSTWYKDSNNHHGNWSGLNLLGLDAAQILKLSKSGQFSFKEYLMSLPALCRVTVFQKNLDWIDRYPELIVNSNKGGGGPTAWDLELNYNGIPVKITPRQGEVKNGGAKYQIIEVYEDVLAKHPCSGLVFRKGQKWIFTGKGKRLMNLLLFR